MYTMCDFSRYYFQVLVHMQITIYLVVVRVKYSFISGLLFSLDRTLICFLIQGCTSPLAIGSY